MAQERQFLGNDGPFLFSERHWESTAAEIDPTTALLGVEPGAAILDMCCGPGRHSLELARRGYRVTGVDRTTVYLEQARQQAEEERLTLEFVEDDMRHFCRPGAFEGAMMMYTSSGYFEDPAENRQVLANICRSLSGRGALIVEMMGKEVLARVFRERDWDEVDDAAILQQRKVSKDWSWMENRWIVFEGQERYEFKVSHWIYSAAELSGMLKECGFSLVDVYGDLEGAPYDHAAERLVAVAHK